MKHQLCTILLLAAACAAQTMYLPSKAEWTATPGIIRQSQGKYPTTVNVVLYQNNCRDKSGDIIDANRLHADSTYHIFATGVGVSATDATVGDCTLATTLTISTAAQPGSQFLVVNEQPKGSSTTSSKGGAVLAMMDATAGPTPSTPEVDVIWDVLSKHVCADSFGNHVPDYLYCIEVKIGNNSGHSLQLAGVGFKVHNPFAGKANIAPDATLTSANTAYQTTRSMAQAGGDTTFRNLAYRSVESMGVIMASFTPFFRNSNHKANWSTASAIVSGAVVQAFDLIAPDHTVRELTNLDDQSFRDGKLINNNQQVRMMVFVDKEILKSSLEERCRDLLTVAPEKTQDGKGKPPSDKDVKKCENSEDPTIVKVLLGNLVIVGEKLDYVERMVVDTSVTSQEVSPKLSATAAIDSANLITVTGTGLPGATITVGGTAVTPTVLSATQLQFKPPTVKSPGESYAIEIKSADGSQTQTINLAVPAAK